jgi:hypothetical protein
MFSVTLFIDDACAAARLDANLGSCHFTMGRINLDLAISANRVCS